MATAVPATERPIPPVTAVPASAAAPPITAAPPAFKNSPRGVERWERDGGGDVLVTLIGFGMSGSARAVLGEVMSVSGSKKPTVRSLSAAVGKLRLFVCMSRRVRYAVRRLSSDTAGRRY